MAGIEQKARWRWRGFKSGLYGEVTITLDNEEAKDPKVAKRVLQGLAIGVTGWVGIILAWVIEKKCNEIVAKNRGRGVRVVASGKLAPAIPSKWDVEVIAR